MSIEKIKKEIIKKAENIFKAKIVLEHPPNSEFGDFAICASSYLSNAKKSGRKTKQLKTRTEQPEPKEKQFSGREKRSSAESEQSIAEKIEKARLEISGLSFVESASIAGQYINIKIKKEVLFKSVISEIQTEKNIYGNKNIGKNKRLMIEYLSPNTNKPLHLGHIRNGALGMALANILENSGYKIIKANLVNDRGEHICKSMLAYQKWGDNETPVSKKIKGDHFVGNFYVRYNKEAIKNPLLKDETQKMLRKWEQGDKKIISLWKKMNSWVYAGFKETYKNLGLKFDIIYYESNIYKLGRKAVLNGLRKKVFFKGRQGDVLFYLPKEFGFEKDGSLKKLTLLRKDGTSVYITQDIGLAILKARQKKLSGSIYVVGAEQNYYFRCLFEVLKALKFPWAQNLYHLSYAMVSLPEGKMKSREGRVVEADDLLQEMERAAEKEIDSRYGQVKDIKSRARKIALGAINFHILFVNPGQVICFDPQKSISFDGSTGPYCQYAYARAKSIIRKSGQGKQGKKIDFSVFKTKEEIELVQKLLQFPGELEKAGINFNPSKIANYVYEFAKIFNRFYVNNPVLNNEDRGITIARLALVRASALVLKKCLLLLNIPILEKM